MSGEEMGDQWGLVMPFVVCASQGGPYEDGAFVAGAEFGEIHTVLRDTKPPEYQRYVHPELVPQLDLLAMHEGYSLTSEPWEDGPDDWTLATFKRLEDASPRCDVELLDVNAAEGEPVVVNRLRINGANVYVPAGAVIEIRAGNQCAVEMTLTVMPSSVVIRRAES